jgi:hypothetical protein
MEVKSYESLKEMYAPDNKEMQSCSQKEFRIWELIVKRKIQKNQLLACSFLQPFEPYLIPIELRLFAVK